MNGLKPCIVDFAEGIEEASFIEFSIRSLPERSQDFWKELVHALRYDSQKELLEIAKCQYEYLELLPVAPIHHMGVENCIHAGDVASLFVLARCSEALFMRRRRPNLTYEHLQKTIYISREHLLLLERRKQNKLRSK